MPTRMATTFVLLPAAHPEDTTYGVPPTAIPGLPRAKILTIPFDVEVWYPRPVREAAYRYIAHAKPIGTLIGVGFSKSGLGIINLALDRPGIFSAIIVFDAPLAHRTLPPWNTEEFYDQPSWEADLPILNLPRIRFMLGDTRLIHIAGANFTADHDEFHTALALPPAPAAASGKPAPYTYHREATLEHHWDSGWLARYAPTAL
jgi:hypothetical protein